MLCVVCAPGSGCGLWSHMDFAVWLCYGHVICGYVMVMLCAVLWVLQVLVVSTRLLRPTDVAELLLTTQRLAPDIGV